MVELQPKKLCDSQRRAPSLVESEDIMSSSVLELVLLAQCVTTLYFGLGIVPREADGSLPFKALQLPVYPHDRAVL